jgi:hypothetical protein
MHLVGCVLTHSSISLEAMNVPIEPAEWLSLNVHRAAVIDGI